MRKSLFILLMLPAMLLATPVDPNLAHQVAQNFLNSTGDSLNAPPTNRPRKLKRVYALYGLTEEEIKVIEQ